jgi:hypothetical protein
MLAVFMPCFAPLSAAASHSHFTAAPEEAGMELLEKLLTGLSDIWSMVSHEPILFSLLAIAIFLVGFGIAFWYYWTGVRILRALHGCKSSELRAMSKRRHDWLHCCNRK